VTLAAYQGTPDYTPELVEVVKAFQAEKGLKADGVVGPGTIRVLMGYEVNKPPPSVEDWTSSTL
jgi:murein L,D-transpeptidase YcbB/YkuD